MSNSKASPNHASDYLQLKNKSWMTDSIRVPGNLCPAYAVFERREMTRMLSVESTAPSSTQKSTELLVLASMLALITLVSMIDVYWSFKTQAILSETEQNPLGKWLIDRDNGDISLFMTLKMAGTMGVILAIPALYLFRRSWGMTAASVLCLFQCGLLVYFYIGHELFPAA